MILVGRPPKPPKPLARDVAITAANGLQRDTFIAAYQSGERKFDFIKSVYGSKATKNKFSRAQHAKCCFCEAIFDANVSGDVEHFRPKKAVMTTGGLIYPGYYWLAYNFENLFYCCPHCNQYKKKNWFPLEHEGDRARSHHQSYLVERPLLLDPAGPRDPRQHIRFDRDFPVGVTASGKKTVECLGLDRHALNRDRRKLLARLEADLNVVKLLAGDARPEAVTEFERAQRTLKDAVLPTAEFSAAAADFLQGWRAP